MEFMTHPLLHPNMYSFSQLTLSFLVPDMRKFEALKQHLIRPLGSEVTLNDVDITQLSPPINTFGKAGQNNGRLAFMRKIRQ